DGASQQELAVALTAPHHLLAVLITAQRPEQPVGLLHANAARRTARWLTYDRSHQNGRSSSSWSNGLGAAFLPAGAGLRTRCCGCCSRSPPLPPSMIRFCTTTSVQ